MSEIKQQAKLPEPLDLSGWRKLPNVLLVGGGMLAIIGFVADKQQFAFSWLLGFMFCLSLGLGALFLVLVHHLFDAGWSVPQRRFLEHMATLLSPWMAVLFIPIALMAPKFIYSWMSENPATDHALHAKLPLFTMAGFSFAMLRCSPGSSSRL